MTINGGRCVKEEVTSLQFATNNNFNLPEITKTAFPSNMAPHPIMTPLVYSRKMFDLTK